MRGLRRIEVAGAGKEHALTDSDQTTSGNEKAGELSRVVDCRPESRADESLVDESLVDESLVEASVAAIRAAWSTRPRVGIVLGSGLAGIADLIDVEATLDYGRIPHFPRVTALGHRGRLLLGRLAGVPVVAMEGRCHRYEGHSLRDVTRPVRVLHRLGIELLVLTNASGGLRPGLLSGDVLVIEDHINLMWSHPLATPLAGMEVARRPSGVPVYDPFQVQRACGVARELGFTAHPGVYAAMTGPCYETRAEYRFLRCIGADVVGMSTVPEAILAARLGVSVLGLSAVTNVCRPDDLATTSGEAVLLAARSTETRMRGIVRGVVAALGG